jgi:hypothetical protein
MLTITIIATTSLLLNVYLKYLNNKLNSQLTNFKIKVQAMNQYIEYIDSQSKVIVDNKTNKNELL